MPIKPFSAPDPDSLLAERKDPDAQVYAFLSNVPLYATVRIIGHVIPGKKQRSHWLSWIIEDKRWARNRSVRDIPREVLDWAAAAVAEAYPDLETATGLSPYEVAELRAEQAKKREKYKKKRPGFLD